MAFPDHIEGTVEAAHSSAKVWAALTTGRGPGAWSGSEATIGLRPDTYILIRNSKQPCCTASTGDRCLGREWVCSPGGVVVAAVEGHLGEAGAVGVGRVDV